VEARPERSTHRELDPNRSDRSHAPNGRGPHGAPRSPWPTNARPNKRRESVARAMAADVGWHGHAPVGSVDGPERFRSEGWEPLRRSFPDLDRETFIFFAGTSNARHDFDTSKDGHRWVMGGGGQACPRSVHKRTDQHGHKRLSGRSGTGYDFRKTPGQRTDPARVARRVPVTSLFFTRQRSRVRVPHRPRL